MKSKPIRVLQILGIVAGGGVEAVIMNYYEHIDRSQVQFDFVVHNDSPVDITEKVEAMGGKVYKVTPYTKNVFAFMYDVYKIIKKNHYTIVHSNMNTLSVFSLFPAWMAGVPVRILHNHSTSVPSETKRNIMKMILRPFAKLFANKYFACSQLAAEWMYGKSSAESGKVTIIHNAIDLKKYAFDQDKRDRIRKELGIENKFVIGHVGRFMYQKNHEFLIDVFYELLKFRKDAVLLMIGDGPLHNNIRDKINELGVADYVVDLGIRDDVNELYNVMDVFCFPTRYEGLGMVVVEAEANDLPSLVSESVPNEAVVLPNLVKYFPLTLKTACDWAMELNHLRRKQTNSQDFFCCFEEKGYYIKKESFNLVNHYNKYCNEAKV